MEFALPLDEMTTQEKLTIMEQLWEHLCHAPEDIPSPAWHAPILQARDVAVQQGTEEVLDWGDAKKQILDLFYHRFE